MKKLIIGSLAKSAGKTSVIVGLTKAYGKTIGYMKPFGDRLLYKKKRLWDYDSALVTGIFGLKENPEDMSIGFEHAKLRYMYDEAETKKKLSEMASHNGEGKDILFVEGPENLAAGVSIHLDVISAARNLGGRLILVLSGSEDSIIDGAAFINKYIDMSQVDLAGVIVNKVHDVEDFKNTYLGSIAGLGINVLGVIPYQKVLGRFSVGYLADALFARVIAGEAGLSRMVKRIYIGAMAADTVVRDHIFEKEDKKLVITGGDRSDMIIAALETDTSAIIVTCNVLPEPTIISKASELGVPLLMVSADTYQVVKQIDALEPLLTKGATEEIELLGKLARECIALNALTG